MGRLVKTGSGTSQNGRLIRVGESTVKPYFQTAQKRTVTALPNAGTPTADRARLGLATGGNPVSDSLTRFTRERENEAMAVHNRDARVRAWTEAAAPELTGGELGALNRRLNSIGVERTALEQKQRASAAQANWNRTAAGRSRGLAPERRTAAGLDSGEVRKRIEALERERSALLPQYYAAKNEATLRRMEGDGALKSLYAQAKGLREDLDRAALAQTGGGAAGAQGDGGAAGAAWTDLQKKYGVSRAAELPALHERLLREFGALEEQLAAQGVDYEYLRAYEQMAEDRAAWVEKQAETEAYAREHPVMASVESVLKSPMQGLDLLSLGTPGAGRNDPDSPDTYVPLNVYGMDVSNFVNTVRGTVSEEIEQNTDWELFGQNVASFLYQTGMSVADSAAQVALFGPGAAYLMGASAAANQAREVIERGGTNRQALLSGLAAGAAEALFEKVSVERLLSERSVRSMRDLLAETLKQAGTEASEEMLTEVSNLLSDAAIMGSGSNFAARVERHRQEGLSEEEARRRAFLDCLSQVAWAGAGGALSGGVMGGAVRGANYLSGAWNQAQSAGASRPTNAEMLNSLNRQRSQPGQVEADTNLRPLAAGQNNTASSGKAELPRMTMQDFTDVNSPVWNNVSYDDTETQTKIMRDTHQEMVDSGEVVQIPERTVEQVSQSYPDLRTMKKAERTPILRQKINELKRSLRQFLNGLKGGSYEFEVNGNLLEAKLYDTGIKEVMEKVNQEKASMLYHSDQIFQNARYLYSTPDYDGDPNIYRWNYFYTPVQIGDQTVGVRIAVRDITQGENHQPESQIYNWGIKTGAALDGGQPGSFASSSGVSSAAPQDAALGASASSAASLIPIISENPAGGNPQSARNRTGVTAVGDEYLRQALDEVWQGADGPSVRGPQEDGIHNAEQPRVLDSIRNAGYDNHGIKEDTEGLSLPTLESGNEGKVETSVEEGIANVHRRAAQENKRSAGLRAENQGRTQRNGEAEIGDGTGRAVSPSERYGRIDPTYEQVPVRSWVNDGLIAPRAGSIVGLEQQTAMEYGIPSFVVSDTVWEQNKGKTPAFSAGGQIFLRETLPEEGRGTYVPHEVTHVMKQVGYQPYLDFIQRTPDMLNLSSVYTRELLKGIAEHRGIFTADITAEQAEKVYDELNATIYGSIAAGEEGALELVRPAFEDFDAYTAELLEIHRQFKEQRSRSYPEELGAARPGEESLDERGGKFIRGSEPYDEFVGNIQRMLHAGAGTTAQAVRTGQEDNVQRALEEGWRDEAPSVRGPEEDNLSFSLRKPISLDRANWGYGPGTEEGAFSEESQLPGRSGAKDFGSEAVPVKEGATFRTEIPEYTEAVNSSISRAGKYAVEQGAKRQGEYLILVDTRTGTWLYEEAGDEVSVGNTEAFRRFVREHPDGRFAYVHAHPSGRGLSLNDMAEFFGDDQFESMVAAGYNGKVYAVYGKRAKISAWQEIMRPSVDAALGEDLRRQLRDDKINTQYFKHELERRRVQYLIDHYCSAWEAET